MTNRLRHIRRVALALGAVELPVAVLWALFGAGIYGSPLSKVSAHGLQVVATLFVLAGPLWMLPLAIVAKWWPRWSGRFMLAGAVSAALFAVHPWGLAYAAWNLYVDVWVAVVVVSLVTAAMAVAFVTVGRSGRAWLDVGATALIASVITLGFTRATERRDVATPWRTAYPVTFLAFAPDGSTLIAAGKFAGADAQWQRFRRLRATVSVVDGATGKVTALAEGSYRHLLVPDRTTLITVDDERTRLWDTRTFRERVAVVRPADALAVSQTRLALARRDGVLLLDAENGQRRAYLKREDGPSWVAIAPEGRTVALGQRSLGAGVTLWDVTSSQSRILPVRQDEIIYNAQFSPDGTLLAMNVASKPTIGEARSFLRLWSVEDNRQLPPLDGPPLWEGPWFSPDGKTLMTAEVDLHAVPPTATWSLWDTVTWRKRSSLPGSHAMAWSPDGATLAVIDARRQEGYGVVRWNVRDGRLLGDIGEVDFFPEAIAFSPEGTMLAVGGQGTEAQGYIPGRIALLQLSR